MEEEIMQPDNTENSKALDETALKQRENGQLPVFEIAGHPFYVDLRMDVLRPKDDFSTLGISFDQINDYYLIEENCYRIPYNPATHAFVELDYQNIKAVPKDLIVIDIPLPQKLDPIGYAREHGFDKVDILSENPLQMHRTAKVIPWDETPIKEIIAQNLKRELKFSETEKSTKPQRKKGRGI